MYIHSPCMHMDADDGDDCFSQFQMSTQQFYSYIWTDSCCCFSQR